MGLFGPENAHKNRTLLDFIFTKYNSISGYLVFMVLEETVFKKCEYIRSTLITQFNCDVLK